MNEERTEFLFRQMEHIRWSFVAHIFSDVQPSHDGGLKHSVIIIITKLGIVVKAVVEQVLSSQTIS